MNKKIKIHYGIIDSPYGKCFIAVSGEEICAMAFSEEVNLVEDLFGENFIADFIWDQELVTKFSKNLFIEDSTVKIREWGTDFQIKVWQELRNIPVGEVLTYEELASRVGKPSAARAVGTAVGSNRISLIVPCHRVVPKKGGVGNYRWGSEIKRDILLAEGVAI